MRTKTMSTHAVTILVTAAFASAAILAPTAGAQYWSQDPNNPNVILFECDEGTQTFVINDGGVDEIFYDAPNGEMTLNYTNGTQEIQAISCDIPPFDTGKEGSVTQCSLLSTVCVTVAAAAIVQCGKVYPVFDWCVGGAVFAGHGASPFQLPGRVDWDGQARCTLESNICPTAGQWQYRSDSVTWPGLIGADGAGSQKNVGFPEGRAYGACIGNGIDNNNIYRIRSENEAVARSYVPGTTVTIESVAAEDAQLASGYTCP